MVFLGDQIFPNQKSSRVNELEMDGLKGGLLLLIF
jgi:hypothetical protein